MNSAFVLTKKYEDCCRCDFVDGYPMGNGSMGTLLHGKARCLEFNLNKINVWDYRYDGVDGFSYAGVTELVKAERWDDLAKVKQTLMESYMKPYPGYAPVGQLVIERGETGMLDACRLDMRDAVISGFKNELGVSDCFVHAERDLMGIRFKPDEKETVRVSLFRQDNGVYPHPVFSLQGDILTMKLRFPDGFSYCVGLKTPPEAIWDLGLGECVLKPGEGEVVLWLTVSTSLDCPDCKSQVLERLEPLSDNAWDSLLASHVAWWHEFWSKSSINLSRKDIESAWYAQIYQLAASSRRGNLPPNLQGIWCDRDYPDWHADYHTDLNVQMTWWPMFTSNHPELALPFTDFFHGLLPKVEQDTRLMWNLPGAKFGSAHDPNGNDIFGYVTSGYWIGSSAWLAELYYWYYLYTQDRDFAQRYAVPFFEKSLEFYQAFLETDNAGRINIPLTTSPESWENGDEAWGSNATCDICLIRELARATLMVYSDLSEVGTYAAFCRELLEKLSPYPLVDGVWAELEGKAYPEPHRHLSSLMPIYPTGEVDLSEGSEERLTAERSYRAFIDRGPVVEWGPTYAWLSIMASRLGNAEDAVKWLDYCLRELSPSLMHVLALNTNDWDGQRRRVYQIDGGAGLAAAVNEMLLSSIGGVIRLFPGVSSDWTCEFTDFRAEGAFLVSSSFEHGRIGKTTVKSQSGGICRLERTHWAEAAVTCSNEPVVCRDSGRTIEFDTQLGETYELVLR